MQYASGGHHLANGCKINKTEHFDKDAEVTHSALNVV